MKDDSLPGLVKRLSDRSGLVRERARHTLVLIGSPAVPLLLELVESRAKRPRWEAAKALASIADPSSVSALVQLLSDPESDIRWIAATGLIRLGPRTLPDVLRFLIENPDSVDIRRAVHHVLYELAIENPVVEESVAPVLKVLGETDPPSAVPPQAELALRQIESLQRGQVSQW